ncbi:hypothetical protein VPHD81_0102 [Vibrio phage D81]
MEDMTIEQANETFPIGTKVKYYPIMGLDKFEETIVRSEPWDVCGETVVKVEGRSGGVSVNHLEVIGLCPNCQLELCVGCGNCHSSECVTGEFNG